MTCKTRPPEIHNPYRLKDLPALGRDSMEFLMLDEEEVDTLIHDLRGEFPRRLAEEFAS